MSVIALVPLVREPILADARRIPAASGIPALDAIHVAVALAEAGRSPMPDGGEIRFVTRDAAQAAAARGEGLVVV
ncbi:MAG TPA: hypothetical protein VNN79_02450 [Actinomycetota bacterium]|nr:hypothetical protein [Actinomycetota bacterium]